MVDSFRWIKLFVENSKVIVSFYLLLASTAGFNIYSGYEKEGELKASQNQVAEVASYYVKTREIKPEQAIEDDCDSCIQLLIEHKREFHE